MPRQGLSVGDIHKNGSDFDQYIGETGKATGERLITNSVVHFFTYFLSTNDVPDSVCSAVNSQSQTEEDS